VEPELKRSAASTKAQQKQATKTLVGPLSVDLGFSFIAFFSSLFL
jgi:hypothetical protein